MRGDWPCSNTLAELLMVEQLHSQHSPHEARKVRGYNDLRLQVPGYILPNTILVDRVIGGNSGELQRSMEGHTVDEQDR